MREVNDILTAWMNSESKSSNAPYIIAPPTTNGSSKPDRLEKWKPSEEANKQTYLFLSGVKRTKKIC